ncbi:methylamine dehydrogenase light chain [Sphingobium sp. AN641]|uniref:methylamine dehydrogenase light chain n=1 Tax=Sphingobium sp. AN641 TaxID=3133443 RepID=UPI0030BE6463
MKSVEDSVEGAIRNVAGRTSRRGLIGRLGIFLVGGAALPLLPVGRAVAGPVDLGKNKEGTYPGVAAKPSLGPDEEGSVTSCDYWRYCGISGNLCACCGGSANQCPPGTTMSSLAWVGTCLNPKDGKSYIISYNDCCGKTGCKRCSCDRGSENHESSHLVRPQTSGRYLWCGGSGESAIACTTANVVGVAMDSR